MPPPCLGLLEVLRAFAAQLPFDFFSVIFFGLVPWLQFGESGEQIALELEQAPVSVWRCPTFHEAVKKGRGLCRPGRGSHDHTMLSIVLCAPVL